MYSIKPVLEKDMQQRNIGPFYVSPVGLGCMNMSMGYGPRPDEDYSGRLLNQALDQGYNFLDTAAMYGMGHNERLIGQYLSTRRHEYTLASKCGIFKNTEGQTETNGRPEVLKQTCEDSLRRLNTEVIDLYYLHRVDPDVPVEESVGALSRLVEQGKIRCLGLSEVSDDTLRRAHATFPLTALQSEYSLWSRTPERKVLNSCKELGIAFVAFSPLGRQFLTGKASDIRGMWEHDFRLSFARPRFEPDNFKHNSRLLAPMREIAEREDCSLAQLSLAWLLAQSEHVVAIPGTKHIDYMQENIKAAELSLEADTVDELSALIDDGKVAGARYDALRMEAADSERD